MLAYGKCCVAVPATLPPCAVSMVVTEVPPLAAPVPPGSQIAGRSAEAEDPPPRT